MPSVLLFDGVAETPQANGSTLFESKGFLYFETPLVNPAILFVDLKVLLPSGEPRNVPIRIPSKHGGGCQTHRIFRTDEIIPLLNEFGNYSLDWQVFVGSPNSIPIQVYQYYEESELDEVNRKLDQVIATQIIGSALDLAVGLLSGGAVDLIIPALTGGALRSGLEILNPSTEPVLIGFDNTLSPADFEKVLAPGETLSLGAWQTDVYAMAPSGGDVQLDVTEYRAP
ncbi:MAG: hypothetical protein AAGG51_23000 [Cyanobacteria bacterium P01_G01_bin.54]